ncbi:hypothetical protein LP420_21640 [Massilia sp. B-10]|nr:hypothetical protein LP420_21640 [Massilia sp. B-10]
MRKLSGAERHSAEIASAIAAKHGKARLPQGHRVQQGVPGAELPPKDEDLGAQATVRRLPGRQRTAVRTAEQYPGLRGGR